MVIAKTAGWLDDFTFNLEWSQWPPGVLLKTRYRFKFVVRPKYAVNSFLVAGTELGVTQGIYALLSGESVWSFFLAPLGGRMGRAIHV